MSIVILISHDEVRAVHTDCHSAVLTNEIVQCVSHIAVLLPIIGAQLGTLITERKISVASFETFLRPDWVAVEVESLEADVEHVFVSHLSPFLFAARMRAARIICSLRSQSIFIPSVGVIGGLLLKEFSRKSCQKDS